MLLPVAAPVQVYKAATCVLSWAQEKNAFEFAAHLHIPHSPEAVSTSLPADPVAWTSHVHVALCTSHASHG